MSDDLVKRLRDRVSEGGSSQYFPLKEAADRLEALEAALTEARAEIEKLRGALEPFAMAWGIASASGLTRMAFLAAIARDEVAGVHFQRARAAIQEGRK